MFRNMLALLFLFALALPALAAPAPMEHGAPVAMEDCHGKPTKHEGNAPADSHSGPHGCIGCIAPYFAALPVATAGIAIAVPFSEPVRRLTGTAPRPSLPPPRA